LLRKTPLKAQNDHIFLIWGAMAPFTPPGYAYGRPRGLGHRVYTTSLTTADLRHTHCNIVCDVTSRTVFIMPSPWMI